MGKQNKEKEIRRYRKLILDHAEIEVNVKKTSEGNLVASIETFPGCRTQARNLSGLIGMVNDAIYTYFEIPEEHYNDMPSYMPPVELAQALNLYPSKKMIGSVEFKVSV